MAKLETTCTSSGLQTASAVIADNPGKVFGITLIQASAACTLRIYDNSAAAASGTTLAFIKHGTNTTSKSVFFSIPINAKVGIYAVLTGGSANYIVHYVDQNWRS